MARLRTWIAPTPFVQGHFGTGPVDLHIGSQSLNSRVFDLPGGSGQVLDRAYRWFLRAATQASSSQERDDNYLGAARALNNLAVWCMTKSDHPDRNQAAHEALAEAEQIVATKIGGAENLLGGILFNQGNLASAVGHRKVSREYLRRARLLGVS